MPDHDNFVDRRKSPRQDNRGFTLFVSDVFFSSRLTIMNAKPIVVYDEVFSEIEVEKSVYRRLWR